ncbi:MAG: 16S rRNA (guanine(527)-N(7))-methyltransferase RsmG [Peptostreptococcaceae bacterium]|jgi:16S rRNA (guanine527-N7)-methyltransferase|nr:16S rRNA (guanine(527)-N(7))-methyltransferase RsmG [Peptostreptococcaceae bacterium]
MILKEGLDKLNIKYDDDIIDKFKIYKDLLIEWNEKINLTAITEENEVYIKHFLDSISCLLSDKIEENAKVIDVGTGAGFPGLPIKMIRKDIKLTLLDSLNKRINFLKEVCDNIGIDDVEFIHSRAEDGGKNPDYRQQFDVVVSRAVANLTVLLEYTTPFLKVGGYMVCLKGPSLDEELKDAKKALEVLNMEFVEDKEFQIPFDDRTKRLLILKKIGDTPKKYPRKAGKPTKQPLK